MRKFLTITMITTGLLFIGGLVAYISIVPIRDIHNLKKGYVEVLKKELGQKPLYKVTTQRPVNWITLSDLPKEVPGAFIVSEDWSFFDHQGIDYSQLRNAAFDWIRGVRTRGASTISQQLVKNLWLSSEKSLVRKIKEAAITLTLEIQLPKKKILETYLNIIQYGEKVYGIEEASRFYFEKPAINLSADQSAFLAMLLPNPVRYSQSFYDGKLTDYARETIKNILYKMKVARYLAPEKWMAIDLDHLWSVQDTALSQEPLSPAEYDVDSETLFFDEEDLVSH